MAGNAVKSRFGRHRDIPANTMYDINHLPPGPYKIYNKNKKSTSF